MPVSAYLRSQSVVRLFSRGWNDHVQQHKNSAVFWNKLWNDAGCPSGILFDLRQHTKRQYKYILSEKLNVKESISSEGSLLRLLVVKIRLCFGEKLRKLSALPLLVTPTVLWWIHGLSADSELS